MTAPIEVYQLKIHLLGISPQVWRRVRIRSDSTLRDLHTVIQVLFGWEDYHLHRFFLHGTDFENDVNDTGDERRPLRTFQFRIRERFLYEYDFGDLWQHEIRLEKVLPLNSKTVYPYCHSGKRSAPEEDSGGPAVYMKNQTHLCFQAIFGRTAGCHSDPDWVDEEENERPVFNPEAFDLLGMNETLVELFSKSAC